MKKLIFICEVCGHKLEKFGNINDLDEIIACPLCLSAMDLVDIEEKSIGQGELGSIIAVDGMKQNIEQLGNNRSWNLLEELFVDPNNRLKYRKIFFLAGGFVPKKEMKI